MMKRYAYPHRQYHKITLKYHGNPTMEVCVDV